MTRLPRFWRSDRIASLTRIALQTFPVPTNCLVIEKVLGMTKRGFILDMRPSLVFFAVVFGLGLFACTDPEVEREADDRARAAIACETAVKQTLRSPGSAEFPLLSRQVRWSDQERSEGVITSHVDAPNAFGQPVRSHFTCRVQRFEGTLLFQPTVEFRD